MDTTETTRLSTQREDVLAVAKGGTWLTFYEIQAAVQNKTGRYHSEASISARLRDFRKARYGAYTVNRRKRSGNLYEYQVCQPSPRIAEQVKLFQDALASYLGERP